MQVLMKIKNILILTAQFLKEVENKKLFYLI